MIICSACYVPFAAPVPGPVIAPETADPTSPT